ncbi:MAG: radical SAM protein [Pseudomonadota bacterium]|nr:radical SAM protein [Pseudomonadota bacterium]
MSVTDEGMQVPRLDFELTTGCDHRCGHCYNVWGAKEGDAQAGYDPGRPLRTAAFKALMTKAVTQSGCTHLTLTGGEPLLRPDALEVIGHACTLVPAVHLITNGSHVTPAVAAGLTAAGVKSVQLTLLAGDATLHDRLKGAVCFDDTCRAALTLSEAGVAVTICYVAMAENAGELGAVMELACVLGARQISYNRMSPTGVAIHNIARLMPTVEQVEADLDTAEVLGPRLRVSVGTAMPLPPCLFRPERYAWVRFGYCSTGTASPNLVVDPAGNVRSCNLSSGILGNLARQDWAEIMANPYPRDFRREIPAMCKGCAYERSCNGGCKESGFATFGDATHPEPFLWLALHPEARAAMAATWPGPR